jgi:hypothetical protein
MLAVNVIWCPYGRLPDVAMPFSKFALYSNSLSCKNRITSRSGFLPNQASCEAPGSETKKSSYPNNTSNGISYFSQKEVINAVNDCYIFLPLYFSKRKRSCRQATPPLSYPLVQSFVFISPITLYGEENSLPHISLFPAATYPHIELERM